ncbi:uncharacterized protein LOC142590285 [Dermacentor variabilis]|uniref:uncharacterized protein LOC142590285 n=1 Tax=Dermacentor variabilis TaxID=34621 RepID=UPI003F5B251F
MKNFPSSLVIAVVGVLFTIEVTEQASTMVYTPFENGKCQFTGGEYKVGEAMYEIKQCMKWICFRHNSTHGRMVGLGCGKVMATPPCKKIPTREGINPECCEYILCGNRRGPG